MGFRWVRIRGDEPVSPLVVFGRLKVLLHPPTSAPAVKRVQSNAWYNADIPLLCPRAQRVTR